LGKYAEDDRTLAFKHLSQLSSQDLVVMDRGYPSRDWMAALQQQQIPFCARITITQWRAVKQFILSGKSDQVHDMGTPKQSLNLRLLKYCLPNGATLVLITNILSQTLTPADFSQLYRHRWRIEEAFKHIKSRLQVENWSSILPLATEQDFYATLIRANCAACLRLAARPLADTLEAANEPLSSGWRNKLNRAYSVTSLNAHLSRLILFAPCQKVIKKLLLRLQAPSNYVMTKPNRAEKRIIGVRIQGFHSPYKVA
jgi:Transposase DDE domain